MNRLLACSALSNTKLVVWWMGVARAPVTGSGWAPAWMARVPKPKSRSAPEAAGVLFERGSVMAVAQTLRGDEVEGFEPNWPLTLIP
ncbi:hypothetical protein D3C71_1910580 [compost metagenome]